MSEKGKSARRTAGKRRMGPENAVARSALLDAAEAVMRDQGYAALSARTVAARAGLKYQLLFYYFETMDELVLAAYRRCSRKMLDRLEGVLAAEQPLHALWELWSNPFDGALSLEFMAMANHNEVIRAEKIAVAATIHKLVNERLAARLGAASNSDVITPIAATTVIASIGGIMAFDSASGIEAGHTETRALVEWCLARIEPRAKRAPPRSRAPRRSK